MGGLESLDAFMSFLGLVSFVYFLCLMGHLLSIDWAVYIHRKKSDPKMWEIPKSVHKSLTEYLPSLHFQEGLTSHNTVDPGLLFFFFCPRLYCLGRGYERLCILQPSLRWKVCSYEK